MSEEKTLDSLTLLNHLQFKRSWKRGTVPENLKELKEVKRQLVEETFGQIQKAFLIKALKTCKGNITHAAEKVGMQRSNFFALLKKHNISAQDMKGPNME